MMAFDSGLPEPEQVAAQDPVAIHCLNCGSDRLDAAHTPHDDEIVQCLCCGDWNRYSVREPIVSEETRPASTIGQSMTLAAA